MSHFVLFPYNIYSSHSLDSSSGSACRGWGPYNTPSELGESLRGAALPQHSKCRDRDRWWVFRGAGGTGSGQDQAAKEIIAMVMEKVVVTRLCPSLMQKNEPPEDSDHLRNHSLLWEEHLAQWVKAQTVVSHSLGSNPYFVTYEQCAQLGQENLVSLYLSFSINKINRTDKYLKESFW